MILIGYGTRPEWLKLKSVVDELTDRDIPHEVVFTGQHQDLVSEGRKDITIHCYGEHIDNRLDRIVVNILQNQPYNLFDGIDMLVVQGDTASTYALALSAFHHKVEIAHIEAGLRTKNLYSPYPEEGYRQMISRIATTHFCPTYESSLNLEDEGITSSRITENSICLVGNTILDLVKSYKIPKSHTTKEVIITMHRRENIATLGQWFEAFEKIAEKYPTLQFTILTHPSIHKKHYEKLSRVKVEPPTDHKTMCHRIANSRLVITDSGGLQEEGAFLRRRVIVCRYTTERPEGVGDFSVMCTRPENLSSIFDLEIAGNIQVPDKPCPYGDGTAAKQIVDKLGEMKMTFIS